MVEVVNFRKRNDGEQQNAQQNKAGDHHLHQIDHEDHCKSGGVHLRFAGGAAEECDPKTQGDQNAGNYANDVYY